MTARWCFFALALAMLTSPAQANEQLYSLINERLALMQDVAAWKWINQQPISMPEREQVVLQSAIRDGLQFGITTQTSRHFFITQINAAKEIQHCWFDRWAQAPQQYPAPEVAGDLQSETRPALIELGAEITAELPHNTNDPALFQQTTSVDCLSVTSRDAIFEAILGIQIYDSRLAQIRQSGQLRVGTTGDYAPFSYAPIGYAPLNDATDDGQFSGIDIDLAHDLARNLGVEPVFIQTSWPTLMQDLENAQYDIAMSGVSIIAARQTQAYFSKPYHIGGKTPIARCDQTKPLDSLAKIDQPDVTLIVNPGGTNQRFIKERIKLARVKLHDDNRTIFDEIVKGSADVMITDLIEVQLKSQQHRELCGTMAGATLSYQEKGFMMPKDPALLADVNRWLDGMMGQNQLAPIFSKHLSDQTLSN